MDRTIKFDDFWAAIQPESQYDNRKKVAREEWNASPEKHEAIMAWLQKHGSYPQRNPYYFIHDFTLPKVKAETRREPTNYKGKPLPSDKRILSAKYKGEWGMYTQEDVEYFKMEVYHETT